MLMPMPADDQIAALGGRDYGATLWEPGERSVRDARITGYAAWLRDGRGPDLSGNDELWRWTATGPAAFWGSVWVHCDGIGRRRAGAGAAGRAAPATLPAGSGSTGGRRSRPPWARCPA